MAGMLSLFAVKTAGRSDWLECVRRGDGDEAGSTPDIPIAVCSGAIPVGARNDG